ncbi:putative extracellular small neutral protease [Streptomyces sp. NBRC 110611]|uniref:snapalysin n=1 Tax=Streptomyces sp. NBRC 110611 TaxID=1621259 RepID=UPI00082C97B8|nr:snapalysin [Streptomyces sp. NBRC 110611]GAU65407.1 putative extracellular small neutral protease [Streptomyces sp. NBRC 110611]
MRSPKTALSAALGLGLAAALTAAAPVSAASPSPANSGHSTPASIAAYNGSAAEKADTKAFFEAVVKSARAKLKANPGAASVTVTYDASAAPTFKSQIAESASIWNSAVKNVQLQEGSGGDFQYREGDDPRGSYASTDGHGKGFVFLDYKQNQEYNSTRVTAHETGHVLGLPDHYEGPCSELMSGGGPGPSCQNTQPDENERGQVEQLWANGLKGIRTGATS